MGQYLTGLALGFALIMPIGAQNVFMLNQGLTVGIPRVLIAVGVAGVCDSLLIVIGWKGMATVLERSPVSQGMLLLAGILFLFYYGMRLLKARRSQYDETIVPSRATIARDTAAVSLLNPHAILDTVGIIGAAIAAQEITGRTAFASGALTASWVWFLLLAIGAASIRRRLSVGMREGVERLSGVLMLGLAALFVRNLMVLLF